MDVESQFHFATARQRAASIILRKRLNRHAGQGHLRPASPATPRVRHHPFRVVADWLACAIWSTAPESVDDEAACVFGTSGTALDRHFVLTFLKPNNLRLLTAMLAVCAIRDIVACRSGRRLVDGAS